MGKRSFRASAAGVEKLNQAFEKYGKTQDYLAGVGGCTRQTVNKFLTGKPISKELFTSLCNELELDWQDITELEFDHQDENSRTIVTSMNRATGIYTSRTGAVTTVEELNNVKTYITSDTINGQFSITMPGDINSLLNNSEKQNNLLKALIMLSGDKNATISKIEKGSIKITFNVSPDGIKKLDEEPDKIILVARIISRAKGEELDLSDTDLSGVDLSGVDLSGINFSCADLSNANLQDANLANADLDCADLSGANLERANLRGTSLNDTIIDNKWLTVWRIVNQSSVDRNLSGANLERANLTFANLNGANLRSANLNGANLSGADLSGANLIVADLSGATLWSANLNGANLTFANLSGADLTFANLNAANLNAANLIGATLWGANLNAANLIGADLSGATLWSANLSGATLWSANLSGADLRSADLRSADLTSTKVENAQFKETSGITEDAKRELKQRGAIFEDSPGDRSKIPTR
ncbi:pentapeptide repeat-containing protein [Anabaena cylindrica FACHB-243]|uniref:Transcriptional regulator, XRE family n=1 Tax=Anabaena cylindrica (strain ATCC 27899 / PCC 7122) TaxID=272123 RepID=K9ZQ39_ANACC|nr:MULTISPECIES: pentapeptide repeat-containing protein [Anabaena]AFZ61281.1 transcriptional regulator, XRE family [Anabaena cylindrica PCC 7122]AZL96582.1 XRE family transcriptional regulator [Anabaena sp. CCAP 1446/1C]MBD2416619.1 pentapeptide repeat-containing protein [Anabaena cylindrica FACHB-243]MBY5284486.1 transcriptional regulator, XRE family protein [Anabaena sp. CCAP 1446/1C]MBY5306767.1 transcriptional regulator, XRE family protein [Anabaena sp. CCAP 1446/1C]